ncbi:MAG: PAS domain S-box protein, partial [Methanomassiliicoccales archaeon]|nr:PAS domain S-box protein [Methanomassiliicoccales archaeon]
MEDSNPKIATLFVDDELPLLEIAKVFIEREGNVNVDIAGSARVALDMLSTQKYDAIVSDYMMPETSGIEFLKTLRERNDDTPFILFTGRGREEIVIEALNNGADFYLQKGGDSKSQFAELNHSIRQLVSKNRSEKALRESEKRYRTYVQSFKGIAFRGDLNFIPIFFHGAVKAMTGYAEEEFTDGRMPWTNIIHPDDLPTFLRFSEDLTKTPGFSTVLEYRIIRKDGQIRWVLESIANVVDDSGRIQAVEGAIHDITDRKMAEETITHNFEHFETIIENTSDIIVIIDQDRIIRYASPSMTRTLGYETQELTDVRFLDLIHPNDIDYLEETISRIFTGEHVRTIKNFRIWSKTGSWVLLEATGKLTNDFDREPRIIFTARETIVPRRADDTLASNDWEFLESVEGTTDGIAIVQDSVLKCVNQRLLDIGGYSVEEVLGKDFTDFIWPDEVQRAAEHYKKRMARDQFLSVHETVLKRKDGTRRPVELTAGAIMYEGNPADFLIVHDISERKQIEEELLDSRETYRAIFENTGTATIIVEEDMTISMANKEFETLSGCSKQDIEGKAKWTEFVAKEDLPKMMEFHRLRRIDRGASPLRYGFKFLDKNQNVHDIQLSVDVIKGTKKSVASLQDVSVLKRTGRELEMQNQNQRMLLDNIETMVWYAVDPETYGMVNRARAEFIGERREELEGKKLRDVILVKEECENCLASNTAAFEGKETVHAEEWITTSKGKRLVSVTKTPMLDENGNVKFVVCTGIDITENWKAMNGLELANKKLNLYGSMLRHDTLNKLSVIAANAGLA